MRIPEQWNLPRVVLDRANYIEKLFSLCFDRNVVYIDETGFQISEAVPSHGHAPAGQQPTTETPKKAPRLNCIAALSKSKIESTMYKLMRSKSKKQPNNTFGGVNAVDFRTFVLDLVQKIPLRSVLILDNAKIHHAQLLEDSLWTTIKTTYQIDHLYYLPPYSPFLNPIELVFNIVKQKLPSNITANNLETAAETGFRSITSNQASECFQHAAKFYTQARNKIPFTGKILDPDPPVESN